MSSRSQRTGLKLRTGIWTRPNMAGGASGRNLARAVESDEGAFGPRVRASKVDPDGAVPSDQIRHRYKASTNIVRVKEA